MKNIRSVRKTAINKDVRLYHGTDHAASQFINKFKLELVKHENQIAHWINSDHSKEMIILYSDKDCTRKIYVADNYK